MPTTRLRPKASMTNTPALVKPSIQALLGCASVNGGM